VKELFPRGLANWPTNKSGMPWEAPTPTDPDCRGSIGSRLATEEVRQETAGLRDVSGSPVRTRHQPQAVAPPAFQSGGPLGAGRLPHTAAGTTPFRSYAVRDTAHAGHLAGVRIARHPERASGFPGGAR
jgi:hypothetical protein